MKRYYFKKDNKVLAILKTAKEANEMYLSHIQGLMEHFPNDLVSEWNYTIEEREVKEVASFDTILKSLAKTHSVSGVSLNVLTKFKPVIDAYNKLITIAEEWNESNDFKDDINTMPRAYYPVFIFDKDSNKYRYTKSFCVTKFTDLILPHFRTVYLAEEFGLMYEDLYNIILKAFLNPK